MGAIGLQQFEQATLKDGQQPSAHKKPTPPLPERKEVFLIYKGMPPQIFHPNGQAEYSIHGNVGPLVNESHVFERCFRNGNQTNNPYHKCQKH
jgi:hypothetical protein